MKIKTDGMFWAGCFSAFLVGLDILVNLGDWAEVLWFCPVTAALLSAAFFRRDSRLMTLCLVLAVPAQLPWLVDFAFFFLGGGLGRTATLAQCGVPVFWGSLVVHTSLIPLALWGVLKLGFHRRALIPTMVFGAALMTASFLFTPEYKNVNCVFYSCDGDTYGMDNLTYFLVGCLLRWAVIVPVSFFTLRWLFRDRLFKEEDARADGAQVA